MSRQVVGLLFAMVWLGCGGGNDKPGEPDAAVIVTGEACISGTVTGPAGALAGARVTLAMAGVVREVRTGSDGRFRVADLAAGDFAVGASAPGLEYRERSATAAATCTVVDVALATETAKGSWQTLGDPGEAFGGTNSGVLLPDGRLMYCHDTTDPVILDPATNAKVRPPSSGKIQGCHAVTVLPDGRVLYVGGADQPVYGPGTKQVKTYDPVANNWKNHVDLNDARWYPTMAPLPDGSMLVVGGGGINNPTRIKTSETLNPSDMQWTRAGDVALGNEVSPVVLLYTGKLLMTHRPPQLYDPTARMWTAAADFVQGNRLPNGDHADHELFLLADGRVVAIGYKSFTAGVPGNMTEIYDPMANRWTLGAPNPPVRSRASSVMLPDGRILVIGGFKEDAADLTPVNAWGQVKLTDLYDARSNSWRRLADTGIAREYHAMPIVVPDGRVFLVGGEGQPGNEPAMSTIEAFSPPYLARGPRPEISGLGATSFRRGDSLSFDVANTAAPTAIILMGTSATTHFMDSGNGRYLSLPFTQAGSRITATIPTDVARAIPGWYTLFVLVDDIPSVGKIVKVTL